MQGSSNSIVTPETGHSTAARTSESHEEEIQVIGEGEQQQGDAQQQQRQQQDEQGNAAAQVEVATAMPSSSSDREGSGDGHHQSQVKQQQSQSQQHPEHAADTSTMGNIDDAAALLNASVPVQGPYRHNGHRVPPHRLPKGILKPAPVPAARFSFRRDVLGYVGDSIASVANSVAQSTVADPTLANASHGGGGVQSIPRDAVNAHTTTQSVVPAAAGAGAAARPSGGGTFWRRIGGAVAATVASQVPAAQAAAQRTIHQLSSSSTSNEPSLALASASSSSPIASTSTLPSSSLDNPTPTDTLDTSSVKSVRFTMSALTVVYPINAPSPPGTEASTRKKVNREYRAKVKERSKRGGWTGEELLRLYDECCRTREEPGIERIRRLLMESVHPPKVIDLKDVPLTKGAIEVLSDLLSVDFGLRKLCLENCGLDDDSLKPLIHSLLVSGTLPTLSLANNKRIRGKGWKLVAVFVKRANMLKYLDISENLVDRKIAEILVAALAKKNVGGEMKTGADVQSSGQDKANGHAHIQIAAAGKMGEVARESAETANDQEEEEDLPPQWAAPLLSRHPSSASVSRSASSISSSAHHLSHHSESALTSLRLESCQLKNPALECLANGIRQSGIKHISLRRNRITNTGAVALAVMIRDYELPPGGDSTASSGGGMVMMSPNGLFSSSSGEETRPASPNGYATPPLPLQGRAPPPANSVTARLEAAAQAAASRPLPSLPSSSTVSRSSHLNGPSRSSSLLSSSSTTATGQSSSSSTILHDEYSEDTDSFGPERNRGRVMPEREAARHAELKARLRKQIDALPRVGCLLTLDVRSNEIKGGVTYIAQVLKRNRTLKVLNLSDNKIDSQGLMNIAEALKYNATLETLDLSNNPCCGTSLEGINTLRTALAFNTSLMRVFLTNTDFNTSAAISLAEFLPEVHSLIHLDLTDNSDIELAGIMALAAAVRLNTTLRCLDLSIPPNDPEYARLSQDVLQSCIRNTEAAQEQSVAKGLGKQSIATPIYKSEIARELRELSEHGRRTLEKAEKYLLASAAPAATVHDQEGEGEGEQLDMKKIVETAKECLGILRETIEPDEERKRQNEPLQGAETVKLVLDQAYAAEFQLLELGKRLHGKQREAAGIFTSHLGSLLNRAKVLYDAQPKTGAGLSLAVDKTSNLLSPVTPVKSPLSPSEQLPSPNFSITSSDDEEESDTYSLTSSRDDGRTPPTSPLKARHQHHGSRPPRPASLELPPPTFDPSTSNSSPRSPVEKSSRIMVSEEAEVFRKSTARLEDGSSKTLLDVLDTEGEDDKAAEELKQELLEAEVKKTRRSSLTDADGQEVQLAQAQAQAAATKT